MRTARRTAQHTLARLRPFVETTKATLWIVAHTGHSDEAQDRPRGSSALLGAYDTFYRHKKTGEHTGEIKITIDRDGLGGKKISFGVELYDTGAVNEDGEPVVVPHLEVAAAPVKFTFKKGGEPKRVTPTETDTGALLALAKAIKEHGVFIVDDAAGFPDGVATVSKEQSRTVFELENTGRRSTDAVRMAFNRAVKSTIEKGLVNARNDRFWPSE